MKQILFSKTFPAHHPRAGEATGFRERLLQGAKIHTIRAGERWQVGDLFTPLTAYPSQMGGTVLEHICDPLHIVAIYRLMIGKGDYLIEIAGMWHKLSLPDIQLIAFNDGFDNPDDFEAWFAAHDIFLGQILCIRHPDYAHTLPSLTAGQRFNIQ